MSFKHIPLLLCALAAFAAPAQAQFTAAVVAPRVKAKVDTTATKDSVRRAAVAVAARVTDMRKWVDSAAGVSLPASDSMPAANDSAKGKNARAPLMRDSVILARNARLRADSAASIGTVEVHDSTGLEDPDSAKVVPPSSSNRKRADTRTFANGAPAPETASPLPLLALAAVSTLLAGAALRRP